MRSSRSSSPSASWSSATPENRPGRRSTLRRPQRLAALLEAIATTDPAPASGSAAAAVVAASAALVEKCALLSTEHWTGAPGAGARAHDLRLHAEELIELDVHAYLEYVAARRAVRGLRENDRARVIGPALARTVDVPLDVVRSAAEVVKIAAELARRGNPNLRADAVVAAILAAAAAASAVTLIRANLGPGTRDLRLAEARRLSRAAGARAGRLASPGPTGGRGRAPARSRDSGRR
ncbi:MAG: cyclodeaminase/cyclohydrolase family protein [Candidatus Dormibacterales bacterium]